MKNEKGFSLIEVMVSIAIMSVAMAGLMELQYVSMLQSTTADVKNSVTSVTGYVGQIALNQQACTAAITKISQNYGNDVRFDLPDGQVIGTNSNLTNYGIFVRSFTFLNPALSGTGADGSKAYFGTLALSLATKKQVIGPNTFAPRSVASVYLTVSPAGVITACGATMPALPQAPPPPAPPADSGPSDDFKKGCSQIGGQMSGGTCTFHSTGGDDNHGSGKDDDGKGKPCDN